MAVGDKDPASARFRTQNSKGNRRFATCCLLAVLLHIPVLLWLNPRVFVSSHAISTPARVSYYTSPKPKAPLPSISKQVVSVSPPIVEKRPQHAEFVSEWDIAVPKETRSSRTSTKQPRKPTLPQRGKKKPPSSSIGNKQSPAVVPLPQTPKGTRGPQVANKKLFDTLFPSTQQLQQDMHLDFADALPSRVQTGDKTQLNTLSWRHATFFNRIKEKVAQTWHPRRQLRRYNPHGLGLQGTTVTTSLWITMNRHGELMNVVVLQSSGFDYLDEAAQAAFWQAQPFLNPPLALFADKEQVSFQFSFAVSMRPVRPTKLGARVLKNPLSSLAFVKRDSRFDALFDVDKSVTLLLN